MTKKSTTISINILSVFIILVCFCIGVVGYTNSWFSTTQKNGVQIIVDVGEMKLQLYQKLATQTNTIYTYDENQENGTTNYVVLDDEIIPDVLTDLNLVLSNEDRGSASMFLRFKFELFVRGVSVDRSIPIEIEGFAQPGESSNGFVKRIVDGETYYYYQNDNGTNEKFEKGATEISLLTGFKVTYDTVLNNSYLSSGSESVYIKLTIDASAADWDA